MGLFDYFQEKKRKKEAMEYFTQLANENAKISTLNSEICDNHLNDPQYGLVLTKPIYVAGSNASTIYLSKLLTTDNTKLTWTRTKALSVNGVNGVVDEYVSFLPNGEQYKTIYINMYCTKTSNKAPEGFILK